MNRKTFLTFLGVLMPAMLIGAPLEKEIPLYQIKKRDTCYGPEYRMYIPLAKGYSDKIGEEILPNLYLHGVKRERDRLLVRLVSKKTHDEYFRQCKELTSKRA